MIGRLDRAAWSVPDSLDGLIDAHLPHATPDIGWAQLQKLFALACGEDAQVLADRYALELTRLCRANGLLA